ncbi:hypothetical protein IAR50_006797 [Cryptococcus sp. DSM 104548]
MRAHFLSLLALFGGVTSAYGAAIQSGVDINQVEDLSRRATTTVTPNTTSYVLSDDFDITATTTTREYTWEIASATASPDGYEREVYTINGEFPGPLIEANTGDTVKITVTNSLDEGQTIHWHGMFQDSTPYMDGVPGISQCPIPSGSSYTYEFTISSQWGTYWYHSHYSVSMADGLWGPIVIHSPDEALVRGTDYEEDRVVFVTDWMHDQSSTIVDGLLSTEGYDGSILPPQGDSTLINGIGNYSSSSDIPSPAEIQVPVNSTVRLRFINVASHAMMRMSIDDHDLEVIEADGNDIYGPTIHEVPVAPAERYSVLINTTQGAEGDAFWIRASTATYCGTTTEQQGKAVLRYTGSSGNLTTSQPTSSAWSDLATSDDECTPMDVAYSLTPRQTESAASTALSTQVLSSEFGTFTNVNGESFFGFAFNNVTYQNQIYNPLLSIVHEGGTINGSLIPTITFEDEGAANIIINNLDAAIDHPYHLHGNCFKIIARGSGTLDAAGVDSQTLSLDNPLQKDTVWVQRGSWVVLRITSDNPGVWPLHCHIDWHLAVGKMAAVVVQPAAIQALTMPSTWADLCSGTDPTAFGPAR